MFSGSTIAKHFSMGKSKCAYRMYIWNGSVLERYVFQSPKEVLLYPVSFDESYSNVLKQGQMDLHVRYWNGEKERVDVHYLNSSCLNILILVLKVLKKTKFYKFTLMDQMSTCHF